MENQASRFVIIAVIALLVGGMAGYFIKGTQGSQQQSTTMVNAENDKQLTLHQDMRKLWTDHVVWTRDYIIASVAGTPDAPAASTRLLKNQEDIGNAIAVYYGKEAGDKLTELLKQHILIAVDLIDAAKFNNTAKFDETNVKWQQNGQDIADFLASANSNWSQQDLRDMMAKHLSTTTGEVVARLNKKYDQEVTAYDLVYDHILMMSDVLSDGIIKQFPGKF